MSKIDFAFRGDAAELIKEIASAKNTTETDVICKAINTYAYLFEKLNNTSKRLIIEEVGAEDVEVDVE